MYGPGAGGPSGPDAVTTTSDPQPHPAARALLRRRKGAQPSRTCRFGGLPQRGPRVPRSRSSGLPQKSTSRSVPSERESASTAAHARSQSDPLARLRHYDALYLDACLDDVAEVERVAKALPVTTSASAQSPQSNARSARKWIAKCLVLMSSSPRSRSRTRGFGGLVAESDQYLADAHERSRLAGTVSESVPIEHASSKARAPPRSAGVVEEEPADASSATAVASWSPAPSTG